MSTADPVSELLCRWEDARRRGESLSPEELCRDDPERLDELRERIAALASLSELLDADASRTQIGPCDSAAGASTRRSSANCSCASCKRATPSLTRTRRAWSTAT